MSFGGGDSEPFSNKQSGSFGRGGFTCGGGFGRSRTDGLRNERSHDFNAENDSEEKENNYNAFSKGFDNVKSTADDNWGFSNHHVSSGFGIDAFMKPDDDNKNNAFKNSNSFKSNNDDWGNIGSSFGSKGRGGFTGRFRNGNNFSNDIGDETTNSTRGFGNRLNNFPPKSDNLFSQSSTAFSGPPRGGGFSKNDRNFGNYDQKFNGGFNNKFDADYKSERPAPNNYVPVVRSIEELYKEDCDHAENYRSVADDDDEIHISGPNFQNHVVLDNWVDAGFGPELMANIVDRSKYIRPRKIQSYVIPIVLEGRDVKGHAETGSGKTAAFLLPIIHMLMNKKPSTHVALARPSPYAIVIEPTRELCNQVYEQGRKLANETGVSVAKAYGQYSMRENLSELQAGSDILCATPGRIKHLIESNLISVENLKYFILDEADTLLESNFLVDIREIINMPGFPDKQERQTMLFSATFPDAVQKLSADVLKDDCLMISNQKMVSANSKVLQRFLNVPANNKKETLLQLLQEDVDMATKKNPENPQLNRTLVFVRRKRDADLVSLYLCEKGIKATTINGDRSQILREKALRDFRNSEVFVLVSTDVCARGIDIKDLDHVINMDLPNDAVTYVHRIGRTGRLKHGVATSFFDEFDQNDINIAKNLVEFVKDVGQTPPDFLVNAANIGSDAYDFGHKTADNNEDYAGQW